MTKPKQVRVPGELDINNEPLPDDKYHAPDVEEKYEEARLFAEGSEKNDPDTLIENGRAGMATKVSKPKPQYPDAKLEIPAPDLPINRPINAGQAMTYAEAIDLKSKGELKRAVLTERGWVPPDLPEPDAKNRHNQGNINIQSLIDQAVKNALKDKNV